MVKVYGASDDLCEIENSCYPDNEIDCYNQQVQIGFNDGTEILVSYGKDEPRLAVWQITVTKEGTAKHLFTECMDEDAEIYSDIFEIDSEIAWHTLIDKGVAR